MSGIVRIKKSAEAECAAQQYCFVLAGKKELRNAWIARHDLFVSGGRVYALVDTDKEVYFMDAITGGLYQFGKHIASNFTLNDIKRNHKRAKAILDNYVGNEVPAVGGSDGAD